MTTTEMPPALDEQAPATADEVNAFLAELEPRLEDSCADLYAMGVRDPNVYKVSEINGSDIYVVDSSKQPGGAFKYYSAATSVLWSTQNDRRVNRLVTGSAGNFSLTMGAAASVLGLSAKAHTPRSLNPKKAAAMDAHNVEVEASHEDVIDAIKAARLEATEDPETAFLHPFNHPYGLKGLQFLARRSLLGMVAAGADLSDKPVQWNWHSGGRSGLVGAATEVFNQKQKGTLGNNVEVHEVRPKRLKTGKVNPRYDGLAVDQPGSWAAPVVGDTRFVQGYHEVSDLDVAIAAQLLRERNPKGVLTYEASALIGLAAALKQAKMGSTPTTYVAVLSGRNIAPGTQQYFDQVLHPGKSQQPQPTTRKPRRVANPGLSGTTAAYRQGPVAPASRRLTVPDEVQSTYGKQLEEWGVSLAHLRP